MYAVREQRHAQIASDAARRGSACNLPCVASADTVGDECQTQLGIPRDGVLVATAAFADIAQPGDISNSGVYHQDGAR